LGAGVVAQPQKQSPLREHLQLDTEPHGQGAAQASEHQQLGPEVQQFAYPWQFARQALQDAVSANAELHRLKTKTQTKAKRIALCNINVWHFFLLMSDATIILGSSSTPITWVVVLIIFILLSAWKKYKKMLQKR
jgi:hypothetical protein